MFIYWCLSDNGVKFNFRSKALIEVGIRFEDTEFGSSIILSMDIDNPISVYEEDYTYGL